jgi:hypothetical protein
LIEIDNNDPLIKIDNNDEKGMRFCLMFDHVLLLKNTMKLMIVTELKKYIYNANELNKINDCKEIKK